MSWRHFLYLLYQTTRASYLADEKNSSLGLIWHLLNPIFMTAVLFTVFRNVELLGEIENFQLFILIGLIHYNFFINSSQRASGYFLNSRSLILNTSVPLELLVIRQICIEGLTLIFEVILVLVLGMFMGASLSASVFVYPFIFIGILALGLGASLLLCGLVVFMADLNYVWGLFCRLLFFLTPVFFSVEVVGTGFTRALLEFNPLTRLITIAREALLYGGPISVTDLGLALIGPLLALVLGLLVFRATRARIPDYI